ncbi:GH12863 [Drosophila grimshawi]|uniref:GH12863 n=1 Tax=Drosophila grimshawi TaxID=7222 RepID=B4K3Q2_DROGR|nr:GH12863 [Drosophila grimshawi]
MIEQSMTRLVTFLNGSARSTPIETQAQAVPPHPTPSPTSSSIYNRKAAENIPKWNLHFDGSAEGLGVEEFINL